MVGQVGTKAWKLTRKHPMPATLIGVGLGWLLVERIRASDTCDSDSFAELTDDLSTSRLAGAAGAVKDAAGHAVDTVRDATSNAYHTVKDATGHAVETIKDAAGTIKDKASDLGHQAQETAAHLKSGARQARMSFWQTMEENPLAVGATILTLGAIAGFALPSTKKEDALMGDTRDQLFGTVREAGHQVVESFQTN